MYYPTVYKGNLSEIIQITDNVFQRIGNLYERDQCNTGIILGDKGILLVDLPEQIPEDEIIEEVETFFQRNVTGVVFTHAHGDHRKGIVTLKNRLLMAVSSKSCKEEIQSCHPDFSPEQWITVEHGERRCIDGVEFLFWIPGKMPAHSPWDLCINLVNEQIVFTGDFIVPTKYLYAHSSNWQNWSEELGNFHGTYKEQLLLMGHGYPVKADQMLPMLQEYVLLLGNISDKASAYELEQLLRTDMYSFMPEIKNALDFSDKTTVLRQIKEIQRI